MSFKKRLALLLAVTSVCSVMSVGTSMTPAAAVDVPGVDYLDVEVPVGSIVSTVRTGEGETSAPEIAAEAATCFIRMRANWKHPMDSNIKQIQYLGSTTCTGLRTQPYQYGYARLLTVNRNEESRGNTYDGFMYYAVSNGSYYPAPVGKTHILHYHFEILLPIGYLWVGSDPRCKGWGTGVIVCDYEMPFRVTKS
ncbi:MAG TPA: hypothetical protein VHI71_07505 [Actinomycetota bacterium]|nr:hypothetical protein [Actinomycetota bacterium]